MPVRTAVHWRRAGTDRSWLTARGAAAGRRAEALDDGRIPFGWDRKVRRWIWPSRYFRICQGSFAAMGAPEGVDVVHPFVAPAVLAGLAAAGGIAGFGSRDELMDRLFAHVLPEQIRHRHSKATFTDPLWTEASTTFARSWSGLGVDTGLVDAERLRAHWLSGDRDLLSTTLLQSAWLADQARTTDGDPRAGRSGQSVEPVDERGHGRVGRRPVAGSRQAHHGPGDQPEPRTGVVLREA
jgi:hypothetical protein